jgi:hypothetical protein
VTASFCKRNRVAATRSHARIHTHICVALFAPLLLAGVYCSSNHQSSSSQWRIGMAVEQSNVFIVISSTGRKTPFRMHLQWKKRSASLL